MNYYETYAKIIGIHFEKENASDATTVYLI